jgi:hypothetical protein
MIGARGAIRIPVCDECRDKTMNRDPETWARIHEILREVD